MPKGEYTWDEEGIKAFSNRVRELRTERKLSQEKLAMNCGFANSQISRIETGAINTSLSHVCIIARELDVELTELMNFKLSKKKKS